MNYENEYAVGEKPKTEAMKDFREMLMHAWTVKRLTEPEKANLYALLSQMEAQGRIKGSYAQRYEHLNDIFSAFLAALSYHWESWREPVGNKENTDNLRRARAMLEAVEVTGYKAQLSHPTEPNTVDRIIDIDADALRVLIAHYELQRINDTRPAWQESEPFNTPKPPRKEPQEARE